MKKTAKTKTKIIGFSYDSRLQVNPNRVLITPNVSLARLILSGKFVFENCSKPINPDKKSCKFWLSVDDAKLFISAVAINYTRCKDTVSNIVCRTDKCKSDE